MRIALVAEWLDSWRGGAETSTLQFLHHLMQTDIEVHVFTRSRPAPTPGMSVHTVSGASMSRTRRSMTFGYRVEKVIRAASFDLVHAISPCRAATVYQPRGGTVAESIERNLALQRPGTAQTIKRYANRFNVKQRYLLKLERELLGRPDGPVIIAISKYVEDQLKRHYDVPNERIRVIYNGVDPDVSTAAQRQKNQMNIRKELGVAESDCLVIQVAHNFRLKGVRRWMEALALMIQSGVRDVRSLVIGKGDSARWHRLASRLGLDGYLTFVGASDRVPAFYHAADVLVHPTYYDPCSRVVLEGMAAGLPCITTRWDGASERIEHGKNGFVLDDPWNVERLADLVHQLREAGLRAALGTRAAQVADAAAMSRHAREVIRLYEDLMPAGARA